MDASYLESDKNPTTQFNPVLSSLVYYSNKASSGRLTHHLSVTVIGIAWSISRFENTSQEKLEKSAHRFAFCV